MKFKKKAAIEDVLEAVKEDGMALHFVPEPLRTEALCLEAVKQNGLALRFVPLALRTEAVCLAALAHGRVADYAPAAAYVPVRLLAESATVCEAAVRQYGLLLKRVPEALRTTAICAAAVRQNGLALRWVPEDMKTPEICADAVCSSGWAVKHVPADLLTEDLCLVAARDAGAEALELMPHEMVTRRICGAVAARDGIDPETVWQDTCERRDAVPAWKLARSADAVRAKLEAQGIPEQDIEDAVSWARGGQQ